MGLACNPSDPNFAKIMMLKKEVMASVLSAGVRVNDQALRRKDKDKVADMLNRVKMKGLVPGKPMTEDERLRNELFGSDF